MPDNVVKGYEGERQDESKEYAQPELNPVIGPSLAWLHQQKRQLMTFHKKLENDGVRIQVDIEEYAKLNQRVMQLTTIVVDSVGKLPAPRVD
jgi:hypothetical protein